MPTVSKKQALACAEALLCNFDRVHDKPDAAMMLVKFTGMPVVLAALAVRALEATGRFPDVYGYLADVDGDFAKGFAEGVFQYDQMQKRSGQPSLPVQFDGHGAGNVIYIADYKARVAA